MQLIAKLGQPQRARVLADRINLRRGGRPRGKIAPNHLPVAAALEHWLMGRRVAGPIRLQFGSGPLAIRTFGHTVSWSAEPPYFEVTNRTLSYIHVVTVHLRPFRPGTQPQFITGPAPLELAEDLLAPQGARSLHVTQWAEFWRVDDDLARIVTSMNRIGQEP